mgnify:FL=1
MRLALTLLRPDGSAVDLLVTADPATRIGDLAAALAERDPLGPRPVDPRPPVSRRRTLRRRTGDRWMPLPPRARLSDVRLAAGDVVSLADAGEDGAAAVLEIRSGPQRGERWPLSAGASVVGRAPDCDVVIRDPRVSARHAGVEIGESLELVDLGSVNGVRVAGEAVGSARGERIDARLGGVEVRIELEPDRGGRAPPEPSTGFIRSPRLQPTFAARSFAVPEAPAAPAPTAFPWTAALAPVLLGVSLAIVTGRPLALLTALATPIVVLGAFLLGRHRARRSAARSRSSLEAALDELDGELEAARTAERAARLAEAPSARDVLLGAVGRGPLLWARRPDEPAFLALRLGLATMPSRSSLEASGRARLAPPLQERLDGLRARCAAVPALPVVGDLGTGAVGCAGALEQVAPVLHGLLVQLLGLHSPNEATIAAVLSPPWATALGWLRWAPHTAADDPLDDGVRLADTAERAERLVAALEELVERRLVARRAVAAVDDAGSILAAPPGGRVPIPAVVVLVSHDAPGDAARLIRLAERGPAAGVLLIWLGRRTTELPAACRTVIEVDEHGTGAVSRLAAAERIAPVRLETLTGVEAEGFARSIAPLVDAATVVEDAGLPPRVMLAELLDRGMLVEPEPEAVRSRWREHAPTGGAPEAARGLRAVVGVADDGAPMAIDLRADGPHALVAGTTGSGKSEFLQTWVLGMACELGPDRVTFLLVDYKGGAAFADCVRLPHCVGLVTDLDPRLVRRALVSLCAELRRREELLAAAGAKDLPALERRVPAGAPPALVIVVDEFATLARDVPEFVDGVVDIAQRGRSLGIHLVLATQRPAGAVRESLRANANLRVALRVADDLDSRDVVGVAAAARFDPSIPGRAILSTGGGRTRIFQTAYTGGTRTSGGAAAIRIAELGFGVGAPWPEVGAPRDDAAAAADAGDQRRLVETIGAAAVLEGIPPPRRPWLDPLPEHVDAVPLARRAGGGIPFGVADDPTRQRRLIARFRPDADGHAVLYGASGSGKTTGLRTIAAAAALGGEPTQVYALDFAGGGLRSLAPLPHVGAVIAADDAERIERLLRTLLRRAEERGARLAAASAATLGEYRAAAGPGEPRILLLVDGYPAFREAWPDGRGGRPALHSAFEELLSSGHRVGIHVVLSADRPGAVPAAVAAHLGRRIVLRLADESGYRLLGLPRDALGEDPPPGRALVDGLETQLAVIGGSGAAGAPGSAAAQAAAIRELAGAEPLATAPPIGRLPAVLAPAQLPDRVGGLPALGLAEDTLDPLGFDPSGILLLAGPPGSGRSAAFLAILGATARAHPAHELVYLGHPRSAAAADPGWSLRATGPEAVASLAEQLRARLEADASPLLAIGVESIADFLRTPAEAPLTELVRLVRRTDGLLLAEQEVSGWTGPWPLLAEVRNARRGLLLQPDPADGELLLRTPIPRLPREAMCPGRGLYVERGRAVRVQLPLAERLIAGMPGAAPQQVLPGFGVPGVPRVPEVPHPAAAEHHPSQQSPLRAPSTSDDRLAAPSAAAG